MNSGTLPRQSTFLESRVTQKYLRCCTQMYGFSPTRNLSLAVDSFNNTTELQSGGPQRGTSTNFSGYTNYPIFPLPQPAESHTSFNWSFIGHATFQGEPGYWFRCVVGCVFFAASWFPQRPTHSLS